MRIISTGTMAEPAEPPLVSVILPVYNRPVYLAEAINSILAQTYPRLELIIVDDGSNDTTPAIIAGFSDPRIVRITHPRNYGAARAFNTGVAASKGVYIGFIGSEDAWLPEKLAEQMACFSRLPSEYGVVYSDMWEIDQGGARKYGHSPEMDGTTIVNQAISDHQVSWLGSGTALIRHECLDCVALFDEDFGCYEDRDLFIRLSQHYRFHHIKKPHYLYRS